MTFKFVSMALVASFAVAIAACGSAPSEPIGTDTNTDPVMVPVVDFDAQLMDGLTIQGNWTANPAVWAVLAISDDMSKPMHVANVPTTHFTIDVPTQFMGKMVTLWVQRVNSHDELVGPESNRTMIGPIEDSVMMVPPVTEDPCESIRSMEARRWTCPEARNGDINLQLEVRDHGATCYVISIVFNMPKERFIFNLPDTFMERDGDYPLTCVPLPE